MVKQDSALRAGVHICTYLAGLCVGAGTLSLATTVNVKRGVVRMASMRVGGERGSRIQYYRGGKPYIALLSTKHGSHCRVSDCKCPVKHKHTYICITPGAYDLPHIHTTDTLTSCNSDDPSVEINIEALRVWALQAIEHTTVLRVGLVWASMRVVVPLTSSDGPERGEGSAWMGR